MQRVFQKPGLSFVHFVDSWIVLLKISAIYEIHEIRELAGEDAFLSKQDWTLFQKNGVAQK